MAINRVEIKDFLVFKGEFVADFCPGVNVLVGGNGTGKTTLLRAMYCLSGSGSIGLLEPYFLKAGKIPGLIFGQFPYEYLKMQATTDGAEARICIRFLRTSGLGEDEGGGDTIFENGRFVLYHPDKYIDDFTGAKSTIYGIGQSELLFTSANYKTISAVYIPEKDMLSHSFGFLALKHERPTIPFDDTLTDIIAKAQLYPKKEMFNNPLCAKIRTIIGGEVAYDNDIFSIVRDNDRTRIPFSMEASGYKKFGLLWKLIRNGLLESGSILFWDEPENSLNPELIPVLVDILLELSRTGIQVFIATHSEILASYFAVNREKGDGVMFYALYKKNGQIKADRGERFDLLVPNSLMSESVRLYEKQIERGLYGNV